MITTADYIVIALYFAFLIGVGAIFRKFLANTSDYFRGGGKMLWWMASIFGGFMLVLMIVIPNSLAVRGAFLFWGLVLGAIGLALLRSARRAHN